MLQSCSNPAILQVIPLLAIFHSTLPVLVTNMHRKAYAE